MSRASPLDQRVAVDNLPIISTSVGPYESAVDCDQQLHLCSVFLHIYVRFQTMLIFTVTLCISMVTVMYVLRAYAGMVVKFTYSIDMLQV